MAEHVADFRTIAEETDWDQAGEQMFRWAIKKAYEEEFIALARELAAKGHARFPDNAVLARWVENLAPPKVLDEYAPPVPGINESVDWFEEHADQYRGQWAAVHNGDLIAVAATRAELKERIADSDLTDILIGEVG